MCGKGKDEKEGLKMTIYDFAKMLDGRRYLFEITKAEEQMAKELGYVVVFGCSDDLAELRGAIDDEIGCLGGGVLTHPALPKPVKAVWCPDGMDCAWAYETELPHAEFCIMEDAELYCIGIVCDVGQRGA